MKKMFLIALLLGCTGLAHADLGASSVVRASYTATADTGLCLTLISTGTGGTQASVPGYLTGIVVGKGVTGSLIIYASSWTTTPVIASITLSGIAPQFMPFFDAALPSISYTKAGVGPITILYRRQ